MVSPIFLHELPIEQINKLSEEDIQQIIKAEQLYYDNKPHTIYHLAVNGAKTKKGGLLKSSSNIWKIKGLSVGRVGDDVIYADGTTSKIISGAGEACIVEGASIALIGSRLENGDEIIESPSTGITIRLFKDQPKPKHFLSHD